MRSRWIIAGLAAVLAVGGSSVYAANSHGQAVSTLARTTTLDGRAHGEAVSDLASQHAATVHAAAAGTPAVTVETTPTPGCADARAALVTLVQSDRTEDASERAAARAEDQEEVAAASNPGGTERGEGDRTADRSESSADLAEDQSEQANDRSEDQAELAPVKAAVAAVRAACAEEEDTDTDSALGAAAALVVSDRIEAGFEAAESASD